MKKPIASLFRCLLACLLMCAGAVALAQAAPAARQEGQAVANAVEQFLKEQSAGLPGTVSIAVTAPDARSLPPACADLQTFFPNGNRAWGKTTVAVRCTSPSWLRYVQARVTVTGDYLVAAVPLTAGQTLHAAQLTTMQGDLSALPPGLVTDPAQAEGRILALSIQAGAPLRLDTLRSTPVIVQGQMVHVIASGAGFRVSTEARALGNAKEGQVVQLKTEAGKLISGIAKGAGLAEVVN